MTENADQSPAASAREPLKPCRHCGCGVDDKIRDSQYSNGPFAADAVPWFCFTCDACGYTSEACRTIAAAIAAWDARPAPAEPPAGVVELRAALADLNALVTKAQNILSAYLQPDGDTDEAVNSLLYLLDGPEQRQIQGAARDALAKTDGSRQWLSMSTKPTPVTAARRR